MSSSLLAARVEAAARLGVSDAAAFLTRLELLEDDLVDPLRRLYGDEHDIDALVARLVTLALDAAVARPDDLRQLDRRREIDSTWFQRCDAVGYVCYVDRFAGTLDGLAERLDYLQELGVSYLHLMPLLRPRSGDSDGGYAVADYRSVDPGLGTMDDLRRLAVTLRSRRISLCIDVVVNHTAREHEWARRAMAGDDRCRAYYLTYGDRELPDRYEQTLREVFPTTAPGNFTWVDEMQAWVWTTFREWQWDLNWSNPDVLVSMLDAILYLANVGVEVFRLDAVPFMWKRGGTDCVNQPEVHDILQVLRAFVRLAAPAVAFKAEAIVAPDQLVRYLGAHERERSECDLAYNNQLMAMLWSSLATKDARLMSTSLSTMRPIPTATAWANYVRGHDDIGWAIRDEDAAAVGWSGLAHRQFLADFYAGRYPDSFGRGRLFQENPNTGDARTSGTAASLAGIEHGLEFASPSAIDAGIKRLLLAHAVVLSFGGVPLIYMGDEIALRNDFSYESDPQRKKDNRWMHRPPMDWAAAERRRDAGTLEHRVFGALSHLIAVRRHLPSLHAAGRLQIVAARAGGLFVYVRRHPRHPAFCGVANFATETQTMWANELVNDAELSRLSVVTASEGVARQANRLDIPPLGYAWLIED